MDLRYRNLLKNVCKVIKTSYPGFSSLRDHHLLGNSKKITFLLSALVFSFTHWEKVGVGQILKFLPTVSNIRKKKMVCIYKCGFQYWLLRSNTNLYPTLFYNRHRAIVTFQAQQRKYYTLKTYIAPEDAQKILCKLLARIPMRIESFSRKGPVKK